jgi:serine/threonine-protein phosphatase 2A regulatory subunit A
VPVSNREAIFDLILSDLNDDVREKAAQSITLCPSAYTKYLADPIPRIRIAVIERSVEVRLVLGDPVGIMTQLGALVKDPVSEVRAALGRVLHEHGKVESDCKAPEFTVTRICPVVRDLLMDPSDDVRVIGSLNLIELAIFHGFDLVFDHMQDLIRLVLTDRQWRVRNNGVQLIFGLALLCSASYFTANVMRFLTRFLTDSCNKVRQFVILGLPTVAQQFGPDWVCQALMVELVKFAKSPNFLDRETYLLALSELLPFFPPDYRANFVFHPAMQLLKDPVPNVVLVAIEVLWLHNGLIHPFRRQNEMRPILETLLEKSGPTVAERAAAFLVECQ